MQQMNQRIRELQDRVTAALDTAQKGQLLSKGMQVSLAAQT
jgi:tRNA U34 5-carboxymethylaminomethyl modifying GTPase MnmE/TrmE